MGVNGKALALAGAFLMSSSIVADWGKLLGQLYWFVFMELRGLGLDTVFAGFSVVCRRTSNGKEQKQGQ
jgi:hypothetical protein